MLQSWTVLFSKFFGNGILIITFDYYIELKMKKIGIISFSNTSSEGGFDQICYQTLL